MQMIFKSAIPCLLFLPLFVARKGFISFVVWKWIKPAQFIIAFYPHFKHNLQLLRNSNFSLKQSTLPLFFLDTSYMIYNLDNVWHFTLIRNLFFVWKITARFGSIGVSFSQSRGDKSKLVKNLCARLKIEISFAIEWLLWQDFRCINTAFPLPKTAVKVYIGERNDQSCN